MKNRGRLALFLSVLLNIVFFVWAFAPNALASLTFTSSGITSDQSLILDSSSTISIGTSSATGILSGSASTAQSLYGNLSVFGSLSPSGSGEISASELQNFLVATTTPTSGKCLTYSGSSWGPGSCAGTGSSSTGTDLVQISDGSGGFIANNSFKEDTTSGYFGIVNPATLSLEAPFTVETNNAARGSGGLNLTNFILNSDSTVSSPGDIHTINNDVTLTGSDAAFTDGTNSLYYGQLLDERTPTATSTVGHQLAVVSREFADGGPNLTCSTCAAFYATASLQASGETVNSLDGYVEDAGAFSGTGTIKQWNGFFVGLPSVANGTNPNLNNVTGFAASDPTNVQHGNGSGCTASFAAGSGGCTTTGGAFAYYSDTTAPSAFLGPLSIGTDSTTTDELAVNGSIRIGSNSGATSTINLISHTTGAVAVTINQPRGGCCRILKWPADSATMVGTTASDGETAVTGSLAAKTLFSFPDTVDRFFRVTVYGVCTSAVTNSTVTVNVLYGDLEQAQTVSSSAQSCAAAGDIISYTTSFYAHEATRSTIQYSTTGVNSPVYDINVVLEELGPNTVNSD